MVLRHAFVVVVCYAIAVVATPFLVLLTQSVFLAARGEAVGGLFSNLPSFIVYGAVITGIYAALPFLVALSILHALKLRNWWSHALLGAPVSYTALALFIFREQSTDHAPYWLAGIGSGFVYWLARRGFGWPAA